MGKQVGRVTAGGGGPRRAGRVPILTPEARARLDRVRCARARLGRVRGRSGESDGRRGIGPCSSRRPPPRRRDCRTQRVKGSPFCPRGVRRPRQAREGRRIAGAHLFDLLQHPLGQPAWPQDARAASRSPTPTRQAPKSTATRIVSTTEPSSRRVEVPVRVVFAFVDVERGLGLELDADQLGFAAEVHTERIGVPAQVHRCARRRSGRRSS